MTTGYVRRCDGCGKEGFKSYADVRVEMYGYFGVEPKTKLSRVTLLESCSWWCYRKILKKATSFDPPSQDRKSVV